MMLDCGRDWIADLAHASYGGVPFFVDKDEVSTGRRLVVHEFPHAEDPYVEDLGREAFLISVTAYVASDQADGEAQSLRSVCSTAGAKRLSLPLESFQAHCDHVSRDFDKDKLGFIAFKLKFVRDGGGAAPLSLGALSRLVEVAAQSLSGPVAQVFGSLYEGIDVASFVSGAAASLVGDIAAALAVTVASMPLDTAALPAINLAISSIAEDAAVIAASGSSGDVLGQRSAVAASVAVTSTLPERVASIIDGIRRAAPDVTSVMALLDLAQVPTAWDPVVDRTTPSRRIMAQNQALLAMVLSAPAVAHYVAMLAEVEYADRRAAIQARADAAEAIDAEIRRLGDLPGAYPVVTALMELSAAAANYFSNAAADLKPVVVADAGRSLPSLWWANRLYGSAARARELVARNRVIHASFMPASVEAVAV